MRIFLFIVSLCMIFVLGCNDEKNQAPKEEVNITADTKDLLTKFVNSKSLVHPLDTALVQLYTNHEFNPFWMENNQLNYLGTQLIEFIEKSSYYGLFPNDYGYDSIKHNPLNSSDDWAKIDLLLTQALLSMTKDIHWGRLPFDSVNLRKDTIINAAFFVEVMDHINNKKNITSTLNQLEPTYIGYQNLKIGLKHFLDSVGNIATYEYLEYPIKDSVEFFMHLKNRFIQERVLHPSTQEVSLDEWKNLIYIYQYRNGLEADGKLSKKVIQLLNDSNWEKFIRIAITLDKMKQLPREMPSSYVMVNLPAFELKVYDDDTVAFKSRIIVGLPATRSPVLNSAFTNYITYPQWTVPYSIVFGEMVPKIIKDPGYLEKERLMVMDWADNLISPDSIDWKKANRNNFPYVLRQMEGDANSLGIMKFNFHNKFSVYLHDTNARWLFSRNDRALSHGCIRVQEFMKLASFLIKDEKTKVKMDSVHHWLSTQTKKVVSGFPKLPLYIRYYSCEEENGRVKFYNDLYSEDKYLRNEYFSKKMSH